MSRYVPRAVRAPAGQRSPRPDSQQAADHGATPGQQGNQQGNKWWTLVAVCLGTFMLLLDTMCRS